MIISTLEELGLFSPSNAIDNIESLTGFINSSENDFLKEKLGSGLYSLLVGYYNSVIRDNVSEYISQMQNGANVNAYARLLYLSQKAVTYDALARAVNLQAISVNGAGVNVASADDYKAADSQAIADFKKACVRESHSAINELLQCLELWAMDIAHASSPDSILEEAEIVEEWKKSRYYYLVSSLLIPSAVVLQEYYNIYDSREKFIQLLPDLRYVQEDILSPIYGDDFIKYLASYPFSKHECLSKHMLHIIHNMRKIMVRYLEFRLSPPANPKSDMTRNEAVKLTNRLSDYISLNQSNFDAEAVEAFISSPLYVDRNKPTETSSRFENNSKNSVIFVTPGLM